jgi:hypothetical protein
VFRYSVNGYVWDYIHDSDFYPRGYLIEHEPKLYDKICAECEAIRKNLIDAWRKYNEQRQ